MPVKPLRRISPVVGPSLCDEMAQEALSASPSRDELERTEREHPELIVRRSGNVLVALYPRGALAYAFRRDREFVEHFPAMFEELLPHARRAGIDRLTFRLLHNPSRPVVEPVLRKLWFTPKKAWIQFSLTRKEMPAKLPAPSRVRFRGGGLDDLEDIVRLDHECFPNTPIPSEVLRARIMQGEGVLLAIAGREVAGCALQYHDDPAAGYLHTLAVSEAYRGRGIGAALTLRVAKRFFAEGSERVDLKTDEDNGTAIRLYVRLGFTQTAAGRDYGRPTDPRAIARIKKLSEGTVIRFGGWR